LGSVFGFLAILRDRRTVTSSVGSCSRDEDVSLALERFREDVNMESDAGVVVVVAVVRVVVMAVVGVVVEVVVVVVVAAILLVVVVGPPPGSEDSTPRRSSRMRSRSGSPLTKSESIVEGFVTFIFHSDTNESTNR
jgi:hypothetical protein